MHIGRICSVLRATGVALLATTASAAAVMPRAEAGQDLASLKLLTTAADAQVQPVIDAKQTYISGSPRTLARAIRQLITPFVWPNSTFYHDDALLPHIEEMLAVLTKVQHRDGTYTIGNYHSPPDTGFLIEDVGIMARILGKDDHEDSQGLADAMLAILRKAAPGLAKGGIHTPNHRWKICAALARISRITDDESLIKRIDEWLAEGIDIDADGIYSERSGNYYAAVSNPSLLTVARELNRTALREPVRSNLELSIEHAEPNCEIETVHSRRQDQNTPRIDNMKEFYPLFRELALLDGNGKFAAMTRLLESRVPSQLGDYLANLIEQPDLAKELPETEEPFVDFQKLYPSVSMVRARKDKLTVSAFGGTDWFHKGEKTDFYNRFGSGLSTNPSIFRAWNGGMVLEGIRVSANFFSMGHFRSNGIQFDSATGVAKLGSVMEVPYYLPIPAEDRNENGTYDLTRSIDGRFYASLDFPKRPTSLRRLQTDISVVPTDAGYDLEFEVTGEKDVPITIEVTFRDNGTVSGVEPTTDAAGNTIYHLKDGEGSYTNGKDTITFGPGNGDGVVNPDAGEQYSWLNGKLVLPGQHVYVTGTTPMKYTLNLGFS